MATASFGCGRRDGRVGEVINAHTPAPSACVKTAIYSAGGTVTLVNPATGATLPVPPLPRGEVVGSGYWQEGRWDKAYSLAYHPTTGRYKLVHAPTFPWTVSWGIGAIYAVHVLTLEEEASWREVASSRDARTRCRLDAGVVSVDGAAYWVTAGGAPTPRVVSFDLEDERVRSFAMPSMIARLRIKDYSLTVVRGRLGVVARVGSGTTVWVRAERRWSHQYTLTSKYIPRPYFAYGDHILKAKGPSLYVHRRKPVPSSGGKLPCAVIEVGHRDQDQDQGMMITNMKGAASHYRAFAHIETAEPLGVYTAKYPPPLINEDVFI
uniref:F-box associated beta-propeller type 3 domain-containing protein n=1 Tax=Aegilops tauschii TaxID=37682 RepID=R7W7T5_AEGTA